MESRDLERSVGAGTSSSASDGAPARETTPVSLSPDAVVGTAQHLRATYVRAAAAADRAVGIWLARTSAPHTPADLPPAYADRASANSARCARSCAHRPLRTRGDCATRARLQSECSCSSRQQLGPTGFPGSALRS